MAISKIYEIVLYVCDFSNPVDCHEAAAWFDHSNIEHTKLQYSNPAQEQDVFSALNTWWSGKSVSSWPFVVFKEQHEDESSSFVKANFIEGLENIKEQLPSIYSIGR